MATPAQVHANRLNAQRSTGPRSVEGKAAVRFNALKHGADAESLVIPGEDPASLDGLSRQYHQQFQPVGPLEASLVEAIVRADWTQYRLARLEAEVFRSMTDGPDGPVALGAAFQQDAAGPNALQKIFRRQQAALRDWYRAIAELRRLQEERPPEQARIAADISAGIGFVPAPDVLPSRAAVAVANPRTAPDRAPEAAG